MRDAVVDVRCSMSMSMSWGKNYGGGLLAVIRVKGELSDFRQVQ
jgi:hypothetical protein